MRIGVGLLVGLSVLAWAASPSGSAEPNQAAPAQQSTPADPNLLLQTKPATIAVSPPAAGDQTGFRRPNAVVGASPLTAEECTQLGGEVKDDYAGVCASGRFCRTTDNNGKAHRVCLSKKQ